MARRFDLVDVFAAEDFAGNPLAVIRADEGLSTERMLAITRWLNLSETTFLLPPGDPAALRKAFAGRPTFVKVATPLEATTVAVPTTEPSCIVNPSDFGFSILD